MKNLSISQNYLICTLNESGKLPALNMEIPVCLVAGALIDLIFAKSIAVGEGRKLSVSSELSKEHQHLNSLYTFIKNSKPIKVETIASEYSFSFSDKRLNLLVKDIGTTMVQLGYASVENSGILGKSLCFIPKKEIVDNVVQNIRTELLEDGAVSDDMVALVSLLNKSNQIKKYFSKHEKEKLKARLKEIKDSSSNMLAKEMIDYIDTLVAVIAVTGMAH